LEPFCLCRLSGRNGGQFTGRRSLIFFVADRGVVRLFDLHVATQHASEEIEGTPIHHAQQICLARVDLPLKLELAREICTARISGISA
ncbi:hypothetical protein WKW50_25955, partial [Ochrobactrum sp. GPK 3]